MLSVESILNLTWFVVSIAMVASVWVGVRSGKITAPMGRAMTATIMLVFILLPVISISDDLQVIRKITEPEDFSFRRHEETVAMDFMLLCFEMLGIALSAMACMFALKRLQVMSRTDERESFFLQDYFGGVVGIRPPPATVAA